ncbi:hypothetical protein [Sphingomonas sp. ID0503]|uniref:hypothetical protein n=1 Tax=Sphingomonas sp. ID0503 TaxID=3399691 RepID=UPI003AFA641B
MPALLLTSVAASAMLVAAPSSFEDGGTSGPVSAAIEGEAADESERYLLPDIAPQYEQRDKPRFRWRFRKVKLRVPLG